MRLEDDSTVKAAEIAAKVAEAKKELDGQVPIVTALTGDEEKAVYTNYILKRIWSALDTRCK